MSDEMHRVNEYSGRCFPAELRNDCELTQPRDTANYADTPYWILWDKSRDKESNINEYSILEAADARYALYPIVGN